jgi:hypothetical protein
MSSDDFSSPWPDEDRVRHYTLNLGFRKVLALIEEMRADGRLGPFEVPTIRMVNPDGSTATPESLAEEFRVALAEGKERT